MIRVALIGAGIFARETYIANIQSNGSRVRLTAILSRSPESIEDALKPLLQQNNNNNNDGSGCGSSSSSSSSSSSYLEVARFSGPDGEDRFFSQAKEVSETNSFNTCPYIMLWWMDGCL